MSVRKEPLGGTGQTSRCVQSVFHAMFGVSHHSVGWIAFVFLLPFKGVGPVAAAPTAAALSSSPLPPFFVELRPKNERSSNPNIVSKNALNKSVFGSDSF